MTIGIVGLGLIGGSFAKTIKANTTHTVLALDTDTATLAQAKRESVIDDILTKDTLSDCNIVLIALYPKATRDFLKGHYPYLSKNTIVIDSCGVKKSVCDFAKEIFCETNGPLFLGGHPMAGKEVSGFVASDAVLYKNASMILTPDKNFPEPSLTEAKDFFLSLGFGTITVTTPEHHDKVIAYTSQMAHVVSNAYMQSPTALEYMGFSAGSFADLTRVAKLDETMWTELFLENQQPLVEELDIILKTLSSFRKLIAEGDEAALKAKLKHGSDLKKRLNQEKEKRA